MSSRENHFVLPRISRMTGYVCMLLCLILAALPVTGDELPSDGRPPVFLNHVIVYIDSIAYAAVGSSDFMTSTFGYCKEKSVAADGGQSSWTGTYVIGENTAVEFFKIVKPRNVGFSAMGFSVEAKGGVEALSDHLTDMGMTNFMRQMRRYEVNGVDMPANDFLAFIPEDTVTETLLSTFVMEDQKEFILSMYSEMNPDSVDITRKCKNRKAYRPDLLLQDITEVELALIDYDYHKLTRELTSYGYQIEQTEEVIRAYGPDIQVILRPKSESQVGICRIRFSLTDKPYEEHEEVFSDKSKLVLNSDRSADWFFSIK